jgi:hypothetical protein
MFLIATWCNYDKKFNYFVVPNQKKGTLRGCLVPYSKNWQANPAD